MQTLSQLSYFPKNSGTPGGIRTPYPLVRSQVLYPNELRAYIWRHRGDSNPQHSVRQTDTLPLSYDGNQSGTLEGTRTLLIGLKGRSFHPKRTRALYLVDVDGFEPPCL